MALNAVSYNPSSVQFRSRYTVRLISDNSETAAEKTGPVSGHPPSTSKETIAAILEASKNDLMGQHESRRDRGDKEAPKKIKSENGRI